ncbi:hypothetical protein T07_6100 [Trichinella nelsoni]|uniref:Uncharacterized protein n=1 Tax=Trichinella nelsoni TaxID=6336 RepID=A0A0V0RJB9_9BILA|nr:hypothetical protein T07_6100 [Trichinella nelsoni]
MITTIRSGTNVAFLVECNNFIVGWFQIRFSLISPSIIAITCLPFKSLIWGHLLKSQKSLMYHGNIALKKIHNHKICKELYFFPDYWILFSKLPLDLKLNLFDYFNFSSYTAVELKNMD